MTHFLVIVRIPGDVPESGVNAALEKALAPYHEFECTGRVDEFVQSVDRTEEVRKQLADREDKSEPVAEYVEGYYGWKLVPVGEEPKRANVHKYGWFRIDAAGELVEAIDRTNPNRKWDCYQVGGRYMGVFPVKTDDSIRLGSPGTFKNEPRAGKSDLLRKREIDWDAVASGTREEIEEFWAEWQRYTAGERFPAFEGPRDRAMRMGLVEVRQGPPEPGEEDRAIPWSREVPPTDTRHGWHDVYKLVTRDELFSTYADCFSPIAGYAYLDESGWHEPGSMGWFGCSSDTPDSYVASKRAFARWLKETPDDAWLVAVDCHI